MTTLVLDTDTGTGNISLTTVNGPGKNLTLTAGTGDIVLSGAVGGTGTNRLGALIIGSDATVSFAAAAAVTAASFTQTGTGTTTFNGAQDYTGAFAFTGAKLTVNNTLATDTDSSGADGDITVTVSESPGFIVGSTPGGNIQPGGTGGTITVNGNTNNNGTITAGPVATGSNAIVLDGNYSGSGVLNGNGTTDPNIVFKGSSVEIGNFVHNDDKVVFDTGTSSVVNHNLTYTSTDLFGDVEIKTGNTVTVTAASTTAGQDPAGTGKTLTLNGTAILDTTAGSWYIGPPSTLPSSWHMLSEPSTPGYGDPNYIYTSTNLAPAFTTGFAGFNGTLNMGNGSTLTTQDFYTQVTLETANPPNPGDHKFTLNAPSGASDTCAINASGNVTVNESFVKVANSTLTMTGNGKELAVRSNQPPGTSADPTPPRAADVKLGNFVVAAGTSGSPIIINSSVIFAGENGVKINSGKFLTTYTDAYIQLNPTGRTSKWDQDGATFDLSGDKHPIVEFGVQGGPDSPTPPTDTTRRTFEIIGSTTWWDLVCKEPMATLKFSNHDDLHSVAGEFVVIPLNGAGTDFEGGGGAATNPYMIELTRLDDTWHFPSSSTDIAPPADVNDSFWYFELKSGAKLSLNYAYLHYSWAKNRIPLPLEGEAVILAIPYVYLAKPAPGTPDYTLGNPRADPTPKFDAATKQSYYNYNWLVANNFFYSFTEDSDGNGRIDRIRVQAAFELVLKPGTFRASVTGYEVDTTKGTNGYAVGTGLTDVDCLYIYLKEKDYSDTSARLSWRVEQNDALQDFATQSINIGLPEHDPMTTWDTAPPRLNYALTLPVESGYGQIYVQFSEPVEVPSTGVTVPLPNTVGTFAATGAEDSDRLIQVTQGYTVADLAESDATYPKFTVTDVEDKAEIASDYKSRDNEFYAYLYPSPKYPKDWTYTEYVEIKGNGSVSFPFKVITPSASPILLSDMKIKNWTDYSASGNLLDNTQSLPYGTDTHRVTDVLISVPPSLLYLNRYFVWPIWAKYKESANAANDNPGDGFWKQKPEDTGIIWEFYGKKYLEDEDIDLQAKRNSALLNLVPEIYFGLSVPDAYRGRAISGGYGHGNPGLWLPKVGPLDFLNLVPKFLPPGDYDSYSRPPDTGLSVNSNYIYHFSKGDYESPAMLDFFFHLGGTPPDLFAARLDIKPGAPIPSNWYQLVRPFSFEIHDITRQRSGVTILNNVINPNNGESTYVHYQLVKGGQVTIQVFTLDGTMVDILYRGHRDAGEYREVWGGKNRGGRAVARGMYFIRVVGPDIDEIRKVMVVK
jgi:hypothetical protein